jgi:flagellar protein FliS
MGQSQLDLVLKVYDGACAAYEAAEQAYRNEDFDAGYEQMERVRRFVTHLYTTLDHEKGGEVAENLAKVYAYLINQIDVIEGTKDLTAIESSLKCLSNIREGWRGVKEQAGTNAEQLELVEAGSSTGEFTTTG